MDKRHIKAQSAMEFMILSSFLLFIFVVILGYVSYNASYVNKKRDIIMGEDLITKVQKEINLAAMVMDGYSREFRLPQKLGRKDYIILIVGNEVIASTDKQDFWRVIPNVTGSINKGENIITKENGTIFLN